MNSPHWHPMQADDLPIVNAIADETHSDLPERQEVFVERFRLFPKGCLRLELFGEIVGYGIAHPWRLYEPPQLDRLLVTLPKRPNCLHIHDIVVRKLARGHGAAQQYLRSMRDLATKLQLPAMSLIAVHGTEALWARYGFTETAAACNLAMKTYGPTAKYLTYDNAA